MGIKVFTDGGCTSNGKSRCKSGLGVYFPENDLKISMKSEEACKKYNIWFNNIHSNNVGEMLAILVALREGKEFSKDIIIYSDSMYCINSVTNWYKKWEMNDWKTANNTSVKNREYIQKILEEKKNYDSVFFIHTHSHRPEPLDKNSDEWFIWNGNNIADKLATDWKD